jgi:hypothetical protein
MVFLQYEPARFLFDAECAQATEISAAMASSAFSVDFYFRDRKQAAGTACWREARRISGNFFPNLVHTCNHQDREIGVAIDMRRCRYEARLSYRIKQCAITNECGQ